MLSAEWKKKGKLDSAALTRAVDRWLPLAVKSVEGQAKLLAPVDIGNLKASINGRVNRDTGIVGTDVNYAEYQEYGTRKMDAQPYMRPALDEMRGPVTRLLLKLYDQEVKKDGVK
jgi:HK97 gp10 family phage protein